MLKAQRLSIWVPGLGCTEVLMQRLFFHLVASGGECSMHMLAST